MAHHLWAFAVSCRAGPPRPPQGFLCTCHSVRVPSAAPPVQVLFINLCLNFQHNPWVIQLPEVLLFSWPLTICLELKSHMLFSFWDLSPKRWHSFTCGSSTRPSVISLPCFSVATSHHEPPCPVPHAPRIWNYVLFSWCPLFHTLNIWSWFPSACNSSRGFGPEAILPSWESWQCLETCVGVCILAKGAAVVEWVEARDAWRASYNKALPSLNVSRAKAEKLCSTCKFPEGWFLFSS